MKESLSLFTNFKTPFSDVEANSAYVYSWSMFKSEAADSRAGDVFGGQ